MASISVEIDEKACTEVMRRYHLKSKRDAINFALRRMVGQPMTTEEALAMEGIG